MIDFEQVWLPQIVRYAELVSAGKLDDAWLGRASPTTSITDPDELHEQVFDDLDAEAVWAENRGACKLTPAAIAAIDSFLGLLRRLDESDAGLLVESDAWARTKTAAYEVVKTVR